MGKWAGPRPLPGQGRKGGRSGPEIRLPRLHSPVERLGRHPGGPERDKEQSCPTPHVRVLLFLLSRTVPNSRAPEREGGRELRPPGGHLFIKGETGRVRDAVRIRDAHFRATPLREALPYLSHRSSPPPSPTCILKPLVVLGLAQAASSGRRNLNRGCGEEESARPRGWKIPSSQSPRSCPAPPAHPRACPIRPVGGRDRGSNAPLAGRPAGRRTA